MLKLYSVDIASIKEVKDFPVNFTGIIEYAHGYKEYVLNGKLHRLGGPSRIWNASHPASPNQKQWYVNAKQVTELEHDLLCDIMKLKGLL